MGKGGSRIPGVPLFRVASQFASQRGHPDRGSGTSLERRTGTESKDLSQYNLRAAFSSKTRTKSPLPFWLIEFVMGARGNIERGPSTRTRPLAACSLGMTALRRSRRGNSCRPSWYQPESRDCGAVIPRFRSGRGSVSRLFDQSDGRTSTCSL